MADHNVAYRTAHLPITQPPVEANPHEAYHALCPLPPLSPVPRPDDPATISDQQENEAAYSQLLVQAVLAILLPTEDLENPTLTALVGQIFSELIIGNVIANKAAQPWLLYEAICIVARDLNEKKTKAKQRIVSGTHNPDLTLPPGKRGRWSARGFFLAIIHIGILAITTIRVLVGTLVMSSSLPPRAIITEDATDTTGSQKEKATKRPASHAAQPLVKVPVLAFSLWPCIANLAQLSTRMPWASGVLSLLQHGVVHGPGRIADLNGPLDRYVNGHVIFSNIHHPIALFGRPCHCVASSVHLACPQSHWTPSPLLE